MLYTQQIKHGWSLNPVYMHGATLKQTQSNTQSNTHISAGME